MMTRNTNEREQKIHRLQQSLSAIRKIAVWTTEQLGERIGVSKQKIRLNLQIGKHKFIPANWK
jgi:DNA-binding XRE family transcriptional regulator